MSKKTEEIIINFKSDVKDMMSNLNKVKEELSNTTKVKNFNSLDKAFDSLTEKASNLFKVLDQPINSEKQLSSVIKQMNDFRTSIRKLFKDFKISGQVDTNASYYDKTMKSFDERIQKSSDSIKDLNNNLKEVKKNIENTQKALNKYNRTDAQKSVLKRRGISQQDFAALGSEKKKNSLYDKIKKVAEKKNLEDEYQSLSDEVEYVNSQRQQKRVHNRKVIASLSGGIPSVTKGNSVINYSFEDETKLSGLKGDLANSIESLKNIQKMIDDPDYADMKDDMIGLLKAEEELRDSLQKEIDEIQRKYEKQIKDDITSEKVVYDSHRLNEALNTWDLNNLTPKKRKELYKLSQQEKKRAQAELQDDEEGYAYDDLSETIGKKFSIKSLIDKMGSVDDDITFIKDFFSKFHLELSEADLRSPEKLIEKIEELNNVLQSEINDEESITKERLQNEIQLNQEKEKQIQNSIIQSENSAEEAKKSKQNYKNYIDIKRLSSVSDISPELQSNLLQGHISSFEEQSRDEIAKSQEQKEQEKANEEKQKIIEKQNEELDKQNKKYQTQRKSITGITQSLQDSLVNQLKWTLSLTSIRSALRDIENTMQELDDSFLSIAAVSDYSMADMWDKYSDYSTLANKVGQSTKDTIETSALWIQQGKEFDEAMTLTEHTIRLATISGQSFATVTQQMTSALQGFKLASDQAETVADVYSELAAKAAADVDGIANAVAKVGSLAYTSGMDLQTTAAMLTEMIESTQEAPSFCF